MSRVSYLERDQAAPRVQPIFTAMADNLNFSIGT